jgi:ribose transport system permease protein
MKYPLTQSQLFWVSLSIVFLVASMSLFVPSFASYDNFYSTSRNISFIALIALGQTLVVASGGIDLSVGSVLGLAGIVTATTMQGGASAAEGVAYGLGAAVACGAVNGFFITVLRLSPFVVTLGMLSIARSLALIVSNNKTLFELCSDEELFFSIGSGQFCRLPAPLILLLCLTLLVALLLTHSTWGRYLFAIGGNEDAALKTGVPVAAIKFSVYIASSVSAGLAGILMVAWLGSISSALGSGYELNVIAATVIGGAQLAGGSGSAFGAVIGSTLIELIRNSLLLTGVNPYWQGAFVDGFILFAMVIERVRRT